MKKLLILILSLSILINISFAIDNTRIAKKSSTTSSNRLAPYINRSFELIPSPDVQILIASFIQLLKNFQFLYIPTKDNNNTTNP